MGNVNSSGGTSRHALVRGATSLGAAMATAVTMLFVVSSSAAASPVAQFDFRALICAILAALSGAFGGLFGGFFASLLAAFGCITPSG